MWLRAKSISKMGCMRLKNHRIYIESLIKKNKFGFLLSIDILYRCYGLELFFSSSRPLKIFIAYRKIKIPGGIKNNKQQPSY